MKRWALGIVAASAILSGVAGAQTAAQTAGMTPEQVVAARQGGMDLVGGTTDSMKAGIAAGMDPKSFESAAAALVSWAKAYPGLYPDGTQNVGGTKAKAEIWSDRAGFEKANAAFVTASEKLYDAAKSGDKAAFQAAFQAEGGTCGGCHRAYKNR